MTSDQRAAAIERHEFGAKQVATVTETSAAALAARAKALVESAYIVAMERPRDLMQTRQKILDACCRPRFAESALYRLPRRSFNRETRQWENIQIEGPSVRFANEACKAYGNLLVDNPPLYEDSAKAIYGVTVTDLEANITISTSYIVQKTIERRELRKNEVAIEVRTGADGNEVFIVQASEGDIAAKNNAAFSKARRNLILQLFPSDILEEARERIDGTRRGEHQRDPGAARKILVDGFGRLDVTVAQLAEWLGHPVDQMTQDEWMTLRDIGTAIKDGEARWSEVMDARRAERASAGESHPGQAQAAQDRRGALTRELAQERIARPDLFAEVLAAQKIRPDTQLEKLVLPALERIKKALDARLDAIPGNEVTEPTAQKGGE